MKLTNRFTFTRLPFDSSSKTHLVCTIQAPVQPKQSKRSPLCIVPAIDLSGSMELQKLDYVKNSLFKLIDHLTTDDYFGLVGFAYDAEILHKVAKLTPERKDRIKVSITKMQARGGTNMGAGISTALEQINNSDIGSDVKSRVIVFTDGQSNSGLVQGEEAFVNLINIKKGKATVSAFGYGTDADPTLLSAITADAVGAGNYAYIRSPDDALTAFGKELGGLVSVFAEDIEVDLTLKQGTRALDVLSDVDSKKNEDGSITVKLKQLLFEETRDLVFEIECDKRDEFFPRDTTIGNTVVKYSHLYSDLNKVIDTVSSPLKLNFVKNEPQTVPDKEVDLIVGRAELAKAQLAAEQNAKAWKYQGAVDIFKLWADKFQARGLDGLTFTSNALAGNYANNISYTASSGVNASVYSVMSTGGATRSYTRDPDALKLFKSAGVGVGANSSTADLMDAFSKTEEKP